MKRKTWQKSKSQIVMNIGPCKHCGKKMVNTESFVVFANKIQAKESYIRIRRPHTMLGAHIEAMR